MTFLDEALKFATVRTAADYQNTDPPIGIDAARNLAEIHNTEVAIRFGSTALAAGIIYSLGGRWLILVSPVIGIAVMIATSELVSSSIAERNFPSSGRRV